jgi:hypothetical protein
MAVLLILKQQLHQHQVLAEMAATSYKPINASTGALFTGEFIDIFDKGQKKSGCFQNERLQIKQINYGIYTKLTIP